MRSQETVGTGRGPASTSDDDDKIRLPNMQKGVEIVGIFLGDVHFTEKAPLSRAEKKNWLGVQERVWREIGQLQQAYEAPIFIAGDVFDRWDSSCALVNSVLSYFPQKAVYAIPGNHDLPNHLYTEVHRSAYWTLVEAGRIHNLTPAGGMPHSIGPLQVTPFPCGFEVTPAKDAHGLVLSVALIHDYIWTEKTGRPHAPEDKRYAKWMGKLKGYEVAVFGDNHKGWLIQKEDKVSLLNCGTLLRRKSDEIDYTPSVGLLHSNGKITRHFLNTSLDQFTEIAEEIKAIEQGLQVDLCGFIEEMVASRESGGNWKNTVLDWIKKNKFSKDVNEIIVRAVEGT